MNRKLKLSELNRKSVEEFKASPKKQVIVVLDNIRSHHNVGSIFRTADAFAFEAVYLCGYTPVPPHREIHKTALGATDSVNWKKFETTLSAIDELKKNDFTILCIEQTEDKIMLDQFKKDPSKKYALVFGNEVEGVEQQVIDACEAVIEIPQQGTKHSLNISICAGIVMWEFI
jgi:23S rRNA (guanosine2251-2'-O)-methyltransferase